MRGMRETHFSNLKSSLDWEIIEKPLFDENNNLIRGYKVVQRNDNGKILNLCKTSCTPTPNEKLLEFTHKLSEQTGMKILGYDDFNNGKKIVAYLQDTENNEVAGCKIENYLVVGNGHDGYTTFFGGTATEMLRCQNAFATINQANKIYHNTNHLTKIDSLLQFYKGYRQEKEEIKQNLETFATIPLSIAERQNLLAQLFELPEPEKVSRVKSKQLEQVSLCIAEESQDLGKNLLGFFEGITKYTSHYQQQKHPSTLNVLGRGAELNKRTYDLCLDVVK